MNDYRAIYDAVNLNFSGASHLWQHAQQEIYCVSHSMQRPSVLYRPSIRREGKDWMALYGENIQDGVVGFGATPALAMEDFDKNWNTQRFGETDTTQCECCTPERKCPDHGAALTSNDD